jgi:hypothetical protein
MLQGADEPTARRRAQDEMDDDSHKKYEMDDDSHEN